MKDWYVTVSVQFQGEAIDFKFIETGYDEEDAKEGARERVMNNLLVVTTETEEVER